MLLADIHAFFQQQIKQNLLTDFSQVSRDNPVIIFGFSFKIRKILRNQLSGSRCHHGSHIHGILDSVIYNLSGCDSRHLCQRLLRIL